MAGARARRAPVPLDDRQYNAVKKVGLDEDLPMSWVIVRALDFWLSYHERNNIDTGEEQGPYRFRRVADEPNTSIQSKGS